MSLNMKQQQLTQLKDFIAICKVKPEVLHLPELAFFKDYIESLDGKIPEYSAPEEGSTSQPAPSAPKEEKPTEPPKSEPEAGAESEESDLELDMSGVIEADSEGVQEMGDDSVEVSEEMMDQSSEKRCEAMEALSEGKLDEAIQLFTESILKNPISAASFAKRAGVFLKLNKPNAAIKDCDRALILNPDQAVAFRYRGRAHRLLGNWEDAARDLATSQKIDYSDEGNEWLKEVMPNAKLIQEHRRKQERRTERKLLKEREERIQKAKEERERAAKEATSNPDMGADFGGMGGAGIPPQMQGLFSDPEVMQAFMDPEVQAAFQDIQTNPANMAKYKNNPKMSKVFDLLESKFRGQGPPGASPFV